ncbi:putative ankyrin repeat protein [Megavirus vitis]|nr:putative ankyrin repeat protein [Megavirus vitis]
MLFKNYSSETNYCCNLKISCKKFSKTSYLVSHLKILDIDVVVDYIWNNKNDVDSQNELGWTALMVACENCTTTKYKTVIKLLLECGANINIQNNKGETALMLLVSNYFENNIDVVKLLLDNGANVNFKTSDKWTALMLASRCSNIPSSTDIIKLLLEYGADVNLCNNKGWSALMLVSKYSENNVNIVQLLLDNGANINLCNNKKWTSLMLVSKYSGNNINIVKLLLDNGANVNLCNDGGWTALMLASNFSNISSSIDIVKLLLEYGANINLCSDKGWTALIIASKNSKNDNNFNVVKILLDHGSNPNIKSNDDHTALSHLAIKNNIKTILLLLDYDADYKMNLTCNFFKHLDSDNILKVINRIEEIAIIKNNFSCVCNDIKNNVNHVHLEPTSFRLKILSIQWYLKTGDIEKVITWNNLSILDYFGIYDIDSLNLKIMDTIKYMD